MQDQHLLQMLSGIIQWINPPDDIAAAINSGISERLSLGIDVIHFNCMLNAFS